MEIVDMQLHEPALFLPWQSASERLRTDLLKEVLQQMMDAVGVSGVVLNPRWDPAFAEELAIEAPGRFASVRQLVTRGGSGPWPRQSVLPEVGVHGAEERIADVYSRPGVVAMRVAFGPRLAPGEYEKLLAGEYDHVFGACVRSGIPLFIIVGGFTEAVEVVAKRFPELQLIVDHFGLAQRPLHKPDEPQWRRLDSVIALAANPNVALKLCGAPAMSDQGYPFEDVWTNVERVIDAFGTDRVAWASDISRFRGRIGEANRMGPEHHYVGKHTYLESLAFFLFADRLSLSDKRKILGGTTRRVLKWPTADDRGAGVDTSAQGAPV